MSSQYPSHFGASACENETLATRRKSRWPLLPTEAKLKLPDASKPAGNPCAQVNFTAGSTLPPNASEPLGIDRMGMTARDKPSSESRSTYLPAIEMAPNPDVRWPD